MLEGVLFLPYPVDFVSPLTVIQTLPESQNVKQGSLILSQVSGNSTDCAAPLMVTLPVPGASLPWLRNVPLSVTEPVPAVELAKLLCRVPLMPTEPVPGVGGCPPLGASDPPVSVGPEGLAVKEGVAVSSHVQATERA